MEERGTVVTGKNGLRNLLLLKKEIDVFYSKNNNNNNTNIRVVVECRKTLLDVEKRPRMREGGRGEIPFEGGK